MTTHSTWRFAALVPVAAAVSACSLTGNGGGKMQPEEFGSTTTHSRNYAAGEATTCEAARRSLLSQGYVITLADAEHVNGKKNFQPQAETHVEVEFHVVCVPDDKQGKKSIAFVNALQDRYALKKSNNSASLGVGVLGSVSLPFSSSDDAMVKVASETITTDLFYERFFALVDRYLAADVAADVPVPVPVGAASAASSTTSTVGPATAPTVSAVAASAPVSSAASAASAASAVSAASAPAVSSVMTSPTPAKAADVTAPAKAASEP